ncbi:uncharacterized protein VTP21DRAFT_3668 [Calcarisporiella thermophila]|uniref:uncharacterized protein n=1 Tax=Calcarisporiella thermophila TaxID=911321 RepID=UPI003743C972
MHPRPTSTYGSNFSPQPSPQKPAAANFSSPNILSPSGISMSPFGGKAPTVPTPFSAGQKGIYSYAKSWRKFDNSLEVGEDDLKGRLMNQDAHKGASIPYRRPQSEQQIPLKPGSRYPEPHSSLTPKNRLPPIASCLPELAAPPPPPPGPAPNVPFSYMHSPFSESRISTDNKEPMRKDSMSIASLIARDTTQNHLTSPSSPPTTKQQMFEQRRPTLPPVLSSLQVDTRLTGSSALVEKSSDLKSEIGRSSLSPIQAKSLAFTMVTANPVFSPSAGEAGKRVRSQSMENHDISPNKRQFSRGSQSSLTLSTSVKGLHNKISHQNAGKTMTISCLHTTVAQKSYGSEKRFLCPPPVVRVYGLVPQQSIAVSVAVAGSAVQDHKITTCDSETAVFKHLHVMGSAKSKRIRLQLFITPAASEMGVQQAGGLPTISLVTDPVTVISKPSTKKKKPSILSSSVGSGKKNYIGGAGAASGNWIVEGGRVAFYNRINSQTVRTKFLDVAQVYSGGGGGIQAKRGDGSSEGMICANGGNWTGFVLSVVRSPSISQFHDRRRSIQNEDDGDSSRPLLYNSTIILTDPDTNLSSPPLIIRKVERGKLLRDEEDSAPVTQMQKVGLERASVDATGMNVTGGTREFMGAGDEGLGFWTIEDDKVEDVVCWTAVGVREMCETFVLPPPHTDAMCSEMKQSRAITRPPRLLENPKYKPGTHTLELAFNCHSSVFRPTHQLSAGDEGDGREQELSDRMGIYLGNMGPLRLRTLPGTYPSIPNSHPDRRSSHSFSPQPSTSPALVDDFDYDEDFPIPRNVSRNECRLVVDLPMASEEIFAGREGVIELPLWLVRTDGVKFLMGGWGMICFLSGGHLARWSVERL